MRSRLERLAARHPGRLLKSTLQAMNQSLQPGSEPLGDSKPPVTFKYLQQALGARHKLEGRNHRELTTIALACDAILQGQLEKGLDILSQRFK